MFDKNKSKPWTVDQVPDLTGKIAIVTGGYTGIGLETTRVLAQRNAKVYIASRSPQKAASALEQLQATIPHANVKFLKLDLADLRSVKAAAEEFIRLESQLHILINNAGVMLPPPEQITTQGYDMSFGVNAIGHYYFTKLLLPTLERTASTGVTVRVVDVSSIAHEGGDKKKIIDYESVKAGPQREARGRMTIYAQSKSANIFVSQVHARRYQGRGITFNSLHPGLIDSELQRDFPYPKILIKALKKVFFRSVQDGAITSLYAATALETENMTGEYLVPLAKVGKARADHYNHEVQEELITWLDRELEKFERSSE